MKTVAAADLLEARTFGQWFCCDSKRDDSAAAKKTGTYDTMRFTRGIESPG
jgi:hypothetical protein